jgi:hypothetical protein
MPAGGVASRGGLRESACEDPFEAVVDSIITGLLPGSNRS